MQPGNRPPEGSSDFLPLPNKERTLNAPAANQMPPVDQRRQSHGAQTVEPDAAEMPLPVPAEHETQYLFRQPAVQPAQLRFIIDVLQVIVEDGHIAHAFLNALHGDS